MGSKYKFHDSEAVYFVTSTVVGWADVFSRDIYRNILLDSLRFCQKHQGLQVHAWVLMPNHFHMICSFKDGNMPGMVLKNIKSFTAIKIIDAIINNQRESRKDWLLPLFEHCLAQVCNIGGVLAHGLRPVPLYYFFQNGWVVIYCGRDKKV